MGENSKTTGLLLTNLPLQQAGPSVYIYHGTLAILDNQASFVQEIAAWHDMYTLALGPSNKPTIVDRKDIKRELASSK